MTGLETVVNDENPAEFPVCGAPMKNWEYAPANEGSPPMTKLEEIARAIAKTQGFNLDGFNPSTRQKYMGFALAALKAMREPSKEMVIAGDDEKEWCIDSSYSSDADGNRHDYTIIASDLPARVYRAMIDAIIQEGEK